MTEKTKRPTRATKAGVTTTAEKPATTKAVPVAKAAPKTKPTTTASTAVKIPKVAKVSPIIPTSKEIKGEKHKKQKLVRDSFTMPEVDYIHLAELKARCLKAGVSAKKSEVLRAALKHLATLSDVELIKIISNLDIIKTGRPTKN